MSKMDRMLNSKREKQTIYEIYRACRLCGAGAGYKMPIIQNVVDLDDTDVELKQKIRECVQIEVHQDDKMPPLICELCVDKVNDFYEFLDMCRQTNKQTRLRLGLPPQSMPGGAPDAGDCILGLTEPVFVNEDSDGEPLAKSKKSQLKVKVKKEPELKKIKIETRASSDSRSRRFKITKRPPTPPRLTRRSKSSKEDNVSLSRLQDRSRPLRAPDKSRPLRVAPKSILKKDTKPEDNSLLRPRLKRSRDKEPVKLEIPAKRVKIAPKPTSPHPTPKSSPKSSPRISKPARSPKIVMKRSPSPPRTFKCKLCNLVSKTSQALGNHMKVHVVTFTNPRLACNPCGLWFPSMEAAASHHKHHRSKSKPYTCRRCTADFKHLSAYGDHFGKNQCLPWNEVPDVKCEVCWQLFATNKLLEDHKCLGEEHRPGGKCGKCNRSYALLKNLKKHESTCTARKKRDVTIDPVLLEKVKPFQVRMSRCDPLLANVKQEHYDVSSVTPDFGLDKNCVYPYITSASRLRIKSETGVDGMVAIKQEIKDEFCTEENYVHWDSEDSESDEDVSCNLVLNSLTKKKRVDSLATLTLKTIFSRRCLGKVPRKHRRVKQDKSMFDSLGNNEIEDDVTRDINNIINNLGDYDDFGVNDYGKRADLTNKSTDNVNDKSSDDVDAKSTDDVDTSRNDVSMVENNDSEKESTDKNDQIDAQNDLNISEENIAANESAEKKDNNSNSNDLIEKNCQNQTQSDVGDENVSMDDKKDIDSAVNENKEAEITRNHDSGSNNDLSSRDNDNKEDLTQVEDKFKVNNGSINDISIDKNDSEVISSTAENDSNDISNINEGESKISNDENQNNDLNDQAAVNDDTISSKNEDKSDVAPNKENSSAKNDLDSQDSNSVGTFNESLLNDAIHSNDGISENNDGDKEVSDKVFNDKFVDDNATEPEQNIYENDENKSQYDNLSLDNLSQDPKISNSEFDFNLLESSTNDSRVTHKNYSTTVEYSEKYSNQSQEERKSDDISRSDTTTKSVVSVITKNEKSQNITDSDDMDDTKLMEALDAQIGESNDSIQTGAVTDKSEPGNTALAENTALDELIAAKNTEKSMDVDMIPDEFNF